MRVKDILCGVEIALHVLPKEHTKEVWQKNLWILKSFCKPNDDVTSAEMRDIKALKANVGLIILFDDKGNVNVVLDTTKYNQKIAALLEGQAYIKFKKDPMESVENKIFLLLKKSSISEVRQQLWSQSLRPPRLYGLPNIHE